MKHPDFIIIGAPKCGTTALFEILGQHPGIRLSKIKEPHFFSYWSDGHPHWATKSIKEYSRLFDKNDPRLQGEASTWYMYSKTAAATIKRLRPNVKLIAMLRNPVARAYSSYLFRLQSGWENCASFEKALEIEKERIAKGAEWDFHYASAGLYYKQLQRFTKMFPANQLKVLLHEDFRNGPEECLKGICEFLNIDSTFRFNTSVSINVTKAPLFPVLNRFLIKYRTDIARIRKILPRALYNGLTRIKDLNVSSRKTLNPLIKERLTEYYREDINLLESLLSRDLSGWLK